MKLVIAIIQPYKLDAVMKALDERKIYLKTVSNVLGCGRQKGVSEVYRGVREAGDRAAARWLSCSLQVAAPIAMFRRPGSHRSTRSRTLSANS